MAAVALERRGIDTAGVTARPFLKWAGGKSQLLPELVRRSPRRIETYYEPFLGGAALFFAVLLSLLTVWLNDVAVSWGTEGMQRVVIEAVEEIAYSKLKTQRSYGTKDFLIHVKDVQGRRLVKPTVVFEPKDDKPKKRLLEDITAKGSNGPSYKDLQHHFVTLKGLKTKE